MKKSIIISTNYWMICLMEEDHDGKSGIYNLGTGKARTFKALAEAISFQVVPPSIEFCHWKTKAVFSFLLL